MSFALGLVDKDLQTFHILRTVYGYQQYYRFHLEISRVKNLFGTIFSSSNLWISLILE